MALANDMTALLDKIERRLGLITLSPHLPVGMQKSDWANIIQTDTLVTFSRYFPNRFKIIITDETCDKKKDQSNVVWYYIKDEILQGCKLLGVKDIDWMDTSSANNSLTNGSIGTYYYPMGGGVCPDELFGSMLYAQMMADFGSLYNRGITIDFQYPNRFSLRGIGNSNYDLSRFVVILLVEHKSLNTISPTMMNTFEQLASADIANFLYMNLRYFDGLETAYINIDLKLSELQDVAQRREQVIEEINNSYVSASNTECPLIWTV